MQLQASAPEVRRQVRLNGLVPDGASRQLPFVPTGPFKQDVRDAANHRRVGGTLLPGKARL